MQKCVVTPKATNTPKPLLEPGTPTAAPVDRPPRRHIVRKPPVADTAAVTPPRPVSPVVNASLDYPPNARPGECYARVHVPAKTQTYTERVLVSAERTETVTVPAVYTTETMQVLKREASFEYVTIPATYKTVTETMVIKPATTKTVITPAQYESVTERTLVRPAYTTWKVGTGLPGATGETRVSETGEILCLVQVPAEYSTTTRQVLKVAEQRVEVPVPAETQQVTRQVVDVAAHVEKREIPAEYQTITIRKLVAAETTRTQVIPAVYSVITKEKVTSGPHLDWEQILCEVNTTPELIGRVQQALKSGGYYSGAISGRFDGDTTNAILAFQRAQRIGSGQLTLQTVKLLGVDAPGQREPDSASSTAAPSN